MTVTVMIMIIALSHPAQALVSDEETMRLDTWQFDNNNAQCSDNVNGWTPYGGNYTPNTNDVDYRFQYTSGDPLTVDMSCSVIHGDGAYNYRFVFSLEVYNQSSWVSQGNPYDLDQWIFNKQPAQTGSWFNTVSVTIPNAGADSTVWCVYYTCEVWNLDTNNFDIDYQNYWALLI